MVLIDLLQYWLYRRWLRKMKARRRMTVITDVSALNDRVRAARFQ